MDGGRGPRRIHRKGGGAAAGVGPPMDSLLGPQLAQRPGRQRVAAAKPPESTATVGCLPRMKTATSVDRGQCERTHTQGRGAQEAEAARGVARHPSATGNQEQSAAVE